MLNGITEGGADVAAHSPPSNNWEKAGAGGNQEPREGGSKNPGVPLQGTVPERGGSAPSLSFTSTKNTKRSKKAK